jgi:hypothetical protein
MSFSNERRIVSEIVQSLYGAERAIKESLNHGTAMRLDFAEIFLTLARARGQCEVLSCKLNALEMPPPK